MCGNSESSENSESQSSIEIYPTNIYEIRDDMSVVGSVIQLTKDYTTGNETFKQESRGTVIEATSRKDRKWKVSLDNDTKKYRLVKARDLQLYEAATLLPNSKSQTDEDSFEY